MSAALDLRAAAAAHVPRLPPGVDLTVLGAAARGTWLGRMVNESSSALVFDGLALQMERAGFADDEVNAVRGFAAEERRHGVLCGAVVTALGGEALATWRDDEAFPEHEDTTAMVAVLRNLVSISCLSETVAVALIGAERIEMPEGELRELLTTIWADEIGHARFGWGVLRREVPRLSAEERRALAAYLPVAFSHVEEHELAHLPTASRPPKSGALLGLCDGRDARTLFYETIASVVVPGLEELGLPARQAWATRHGAANDGRAVDAPMGALA